MVTERVYVNSGFLDISMIYYMILEFNWSRFICNILVINSLREFIGKSLISPTI